MFGCYPQAEAVVSMRMKEMRNDNGHKEATESTKVPLKETFEQSAKPGGDLSCTQNVSWE